MCHEVCYLRRLEDPASLADWRYSCLCSELIPSVTEKSVIFVKELSFPQTAPTDDAFFNRNWAGACRGRWAGLGLMLGWAGLQALDVVLLCKNKKEGGSARTSPVATPMPKSVLS